MRDYLIEIKDFNIAHGLLAHGKLLVGIRGTYDEYSFVFWNDPATKNLAENIKQGTDQLSFFYLQAARQYLQREIDRFRLGQTLDLDVTDAFYRVISEK